MRWTADIVVDAFGLLVRIPVSFTAGGREAAERLAAWICGERRYENLREEGV